MKSTIKSIRQLDVMDCGPTCLMMVSAFYERHVSLELARQLCDKGKRGVTLLGINKAAEELGFKTLPLKVDLDTLVNEAQLPCIVHWQGRHYVVVYKATHKSIFIADPARGKIKLTHKEFLEHWSLNSQDGVALLLQPTNKLTHIDDKHPPRSNGLLMLLDQILRFKKLVAQLGLGAFLGTTLNLIFPFLTQSLVDHGIGNRDLSFLYTILAAQLMLFFGKTSVEFIRGWILVHIGTRINVAVVSEFILKLTRLPLSFFNRRNLGDVLQRIADHRKIEEFLTSHAISIVFSLLNLVVFSFIMITYSWTIFLIFLTGSILSVYWVIMFLNKRKVLDYEQFEAMTDNQNNIVQLVQGMSEIKLNNCASDRRWEWERVQARLYKIRLRALSIEQYQQGGTLFLNEGKNILITFLAAALVIEGELSLGMMMAVTYILGQMNAPIEQLLLFIRQSQDAKISIERMGEIQFMPEEKELGGEYLCEHFKKEAIQLNALSFRYSRHDKKPVLDNLNFNIPKHKVTAIVGASGSGKTTLLKVLLKFYSSYDGKISIGNQELSSMCPDAWRQSVGVVMQDGFIFSDSIARNISMGDHYLDMERIIQSAKAANLHDEIQDLPQGYYTKIGAEGFEISGGQEQRVLIARAIHKKPDYIFFDEATSALDANNEKAIQDNLSRFFKGKTVIIVAHRLSTVKEADQIIVLDKGKVAEIGNHLALTEKKGQYYHLVKNQMELGA